MGKLKSPEVVAKQDEKAEGEDNDNDGVEDQTLKNLE